MSPAPSSFPAEHRFRTQVVGAALLDDAESPRRILAARRAYPEALRGLWEFPGGKVEHGESPQQALVRECREELGVAIRLLREIEGPHPQGWPLGGAAAMRVWTAVVVEPGQERVPLPGGPRPEGSDHLELRWIPAEQPEEEGQELAWIPADLPILAAVREGVRGRAA
ncbi:(deoxy)nucleoside triphosphate pyrophosphohydrolase [Kocuria palustris]|uniref:(deoxy)nucleoside triphosphate pyrophosphohydrolase n=1 Tax=Kocuria palustris TaxID=71999 RepID=UPI0011A1EAC7|nr:NUDIX domain-containing protein [Kocuria palustris]